MLRGSERPELVALGANLTRAQWKCITSYMEMEEPVKMAELALRTGMTRANVYSTLHTTLIKLEEYRRSNNM